MRKRPDLRELTAKQDSVVRARVMEILGKTDFDIVRLMMAAYAQGVEDGGIAVLTRGKDGGGG